MTDPTDPTDPADVRRRDERVTINKEFDSFDAFVSEYVTNISRSGVFIRSRTPLSSGTKVNLKFTVLMDEIETVEGVGEVVRVHDSPPGIGVVFTELSGYSKTIIEQLLTAQATVAEPVEEH
jgi:Tfp pilus assembly protein PilZ